MEKKRIPAKEGSEEMVRLLVLDLDGTLFNSSAQISERNRMAVLAAQRQKQVRVAVASGRSFFILKELCDTIGLERYQGFVIGNNGQDLYDFSTKTLTKGAKIPLAVCRQVMKLAQEEQLEVFAHNNQISMFYSPTGGSKYHPEKESRRYNEMTGYFEMEEDLDKIGLFISTERKDAEQLKDRLQKRIQEAAQVMVVNANCIELVPKGMDKVLGVDHICERLGLEKQEVLVMGDGQNDLKMAQKYPFVAMANALPSVQKAAMRMTLSNDEDGVAYEIERTILGGREDV